MNKQVLVHGQFSVPLHFAGKKCGYKYVLLNKEDKHEFEYIAEHIAWRGVMNRCLDIRDEYISENSKSVIIINVHEHVQALPE